VSCNRTQLCGRLETRCALRFSPAGVALVDFTIAHRSEQKEANTVRKVDCVMKATAAEDLAQQIAKLRVGAQIKASGFLAQASRANSALVLHVQNFELIE
jgi:primosomal replication protein N